MPSQKPKLRDVIWDVCTLPVGICQMFIKQRHTCWVAKHQGRGADLHKAEFHLVALPGVCLEGANLSDASFIHADLHGADLTNANLSHARFHATNLQGANLTNANLSHAHLVSTNLQGANLRGAKLLWAWLAGTDLQNANLTGADLTRSHFLHPDRAMPPELRPELTPERQQAMGFVSPNLAGANLTDAILLGADLLDADLTDTILTGTVCDARTRWPEGFEPEKRGVKVPPMATEWQLKRGEVVLGVLQDCRPDHRPRLPWFRCRFAPTAAFGEVRPLLDEAARLLNADRLEEYFKAHRAIDALPLRIESPDGEILKLEHLDIDGEDVRFRY